MIPTRRAVWLLALGAVLVVGGFVFTPALALVVAFDLAVLALVVVSTFFALRNGHSFMSSDELNRCCRRA